MAMFARPANWTYDQPLFRRATADEERLEAMLAAIALQNEGLWVVESNQTPVAFAWTRREHKAVRMVEFFATSGKIAARSMRLLVERIAESRG